MLFLSLIEPILHWQTYNPSFTRLVSSVKSDYAHTAEFFEAAGDSRATVGTLSKAEWEAVCKLTTESVLALLAN